MHRCVRCGLQKPDSEFYKRQDTKSGLHSYCIPCFKEAKGDHEYNPDAIQRCAQCGELKKGTEYHRNRRRKNGIQDRCKTCVNENMREYAAKNASEDTVIPDSKVCPKCLIDKPASEYTRAKQNKDGLYYQCKDCWQEYQTMRREARKEMTGPREKAPKAPRKRVSPVREWARTNGFHLSDRGPLPVHVKEAYEEAHRLS